MRRLAGSVGLVLAVALAVVLGSRQSPPEAEPRRRHVALPGPTAEEEAGLLEAPRRWLRPSAPTHPPATADHTRRAHGARTTPPSRPGARPAARIRTQPTPGAAVRAPRPASEARAEAGGQSPPREAVPAPRSGASAEDSETLGAAHGWVQPASPVAGGLQAPENAGREPQAAPLDAGAGRAAPEPQRGQVPPQGPTASEPEAPRPVLTPPRPTYAPAPEYPGLRVAVEPQAGVSSAVATRPEGRLRVRLLVRADGTVGAVELLVSSGDAELDRAAVSALGNWRFEPARRDGQPVDSYYVVWVAFRAVQP